MVYRLVPRTLSRPRLSSRLRLMEIRLPPKARIQVRFRRVAGRRLLGGLALVDLVGAVGVVVFVVAHRGPGASLNCTGTRPTP